MWGLGGLTLGASLALLVLKNWTPGWVGATGTWFGAVATVLTLLWAVRSFRSDQAEREATRIAEREKEAATLVEREHGEITEANKRVHRAARWRWTGVRPSHGDDKHPSQNSKPFKARRCH